MSLLLVNYEIWNTACQLFMVRIAEALNAIVISFSWFWQILSKSMKYWYCINLSAVSVSVLWCHCHWSVNLDRSKSNWSKNHLQIIRWASATKLVQNIKNVIEKGTWNELTTCSVITVCMWSGRSKNQIKYLYLDDAGGQLKLEGWLSGCTSLFIFYTSSKEEAPFIGNSDCFF